MIVRIATEDQYRLPDDDAELARLKGEIGAGEERKELER